MIGLIVSVVGGGLLGWLFVWSQSTQHKYDAAASNLLSTIDKTLASLDRGEFTYHTYTKQIDDLHTQWLDFDLSTPDSKRASKSELETCVHMLGAAQLQWKKKVVESVTASADRLKQLDGSITSSWALAQEYRDKAKAMVDSE